MTQAFTIISVQATAQYAVAAMLFAEYAQSIGIDLNFQHFEEELHSIKEMYAAPHGGIFLAIAEDQPCGCVALRPAKTAEANVAELKRMYIRPACQGKGIGKKLLEAAIDLATAQQYRKIWLDTLDTMHPAIQLYKQYGFYAIPAYYHNPIPGALYFEKLLP
jgi:putative acetyltransferase